MKRLLMLFLMVITAVTGVHAEIMTGKERGINYAYNTDTYTMTFWGNGKMGEKCRYAKYFSRRNFQLVGDKTHNIFGKVLIFVLHLLKNGN